MRFWNAFLVADSAPFDFKPNGAKGADTKLFVVEIEDVYLNKDGKQNVLHKNYCVQDLCLSNNIKHVNLTTYKNWNAAYADDY